MRSTLTAVHGDLFQQDDRRLADQLMATLESLPGECRNNMLNKIALVIAYLQRTGDVAPLEHFFESLVMTTRMKRCAAYLQTTVEVEERGEPRDVLDVIAEIEARHSGLGQ